MKQFIINLVIYFILISIVVGLVSYAMYGDATHGVPLIRIFMAMYFAYFKPLYKVKA
jgi:hypothetical protein